MLSLALFFGCYSHGLTQSLENLKSEQTGRSMRISSGNPFDNSDSEKLKPGETKIIAEMEGPGEIKHIWLVPYSDDNIRWSRALVLRIYWDGSDIPSVEVPLGDFFAAGNGMLATVNSLPVKVSSYGRGMNCYWIMPFAKKAVVTLSNESKTDRAGSYYQFDWVKYNSEPTELMYFHARYHQELSPVFGEPYTVFKGKGTGHYVGTVQSSQNGIGHWYGEGDDFFYIDGEEIPSISGTGTEDYFNEAWNMRVHSSLYTGCTIFEPRAPDARITAYRWHIQDPIIFTKSLTFEIERTGYIVDALGNTISSSGSRPDHWSSVAYWYQDDIAEPWCEFPAYKDRINEEIVLFFPKITESIKHSREVELKVNEYNRATFTKPWFQAVNNTIGSWMEVPFTIETEGKYSISIFQLLREDNGIWKVFIDDQDLDVAGESHIAGGYRVSQVNQLQPEEVNKTLDFYNVFQKNEREDFIYGQRRERKIGLFQFSPGNHVIKFVCVGSNPQSAHPETGHLRYNFTADVLSIRKFPFENIEDWLDKVIEEEQRKKRN